MWLAKMWAGGDNDPVIISDSEKYRSDIMQWHWVEWQKINSLIQNHPDHISLFLFRSADQSWPPAS